MILTVFRIGLLRLLNNKQELLLIFLVPVLFFSIFAMIFTRGIGSGTSAIKAAIADDDDSRFSRSLIEQLESQDAISIYRQVWHTTDDWPIERVARASLQRFNLDVLIHFPEETGFAIEQGRTTPRIALYGEGTNPIQGQIVESLLVQAMAAARIASQSPEIFRTPPVDNGAPPREQVTSTQENSSYEFDRIDVFSENKSNPKVAMYAAGIAVMFLLFSATGAGGSLLEESEAGTLDRLLVSQLSVSALLTGKWLYITVLGCLQLTVMFVWAQLVFGVDLLTHLPGFMVMAFCTAAATASLAICLASACRSRTQLNAVSIVIILTMSALGGSMIPRYIMSEEMKRYGQFTFNAWALDGFKKVFWYDQSIAALGREVSVLLSMAIILGVVARFWASRWDIQ